MAKSRYAVNEREECETVAALAGEVLALASRQGFARREFTLRVLRE